MCWSRDVAGAFAVAEAAVLAYLCVRNRLYDRRNVLFHMPLGLQGLRQARRWPNVERPRDYAAGWEDVAISYVRRAAPSRLPW